MELSPVEKDTTDCAYLDHLALDFKAKIYDFLTFPACFSIPIFFSNLNLNFSNLSSLRNLQEQVEKAFCYQKLF